MQFDLLYQTHLPKVETYCTDMFLNIQCKTRTRTTDTKHSHRRKVLFSTWKKVENSENISSQKISGKKQQKSLQHQVHDEESFMFLSTFFQIAQVFLEAVDSESPNQCLDVFLPIELSNVTEKNVFVHIRHLVAELQRLGYIDLVCIEQEASVLNEELGDVV